MTTDKQLEIKALLPVNTKFPDQCRCPYGSRWNYCASRALDGLGLCMECMEFSLYRGTVHHFVVQDGGSHRTTTDTLTCGP